MFRALLACIVLLSSPTFAQKNSAEYAKCAEAANTQLQMNECAKAELDSSDAELNRVYQELLQKRKNDPNATAKTREAQRAWLKFRDAHMAEVFPAPNKRVEYGSMYPLLFALEEASVTRQRTAMLQDILTPKDNPQ
jgi:uncharacterized protein YecT (DUF1311 family)